MERIGFIGLGNMGLPMARNLMEAGFSLRGFDIMQAGRDALTQAGGQAVESVAEAVAEADSVITMLPAGDHVASVYSDTGGVLKNAAKGALLVDCSTIDVATARRVATQARDAGFEMVDAPVSGGVGGAESAQLTFMVGGTEAGFARAEKILTHMGKNIFHAGGAGNGQVAKICNNMLLGVSMIGTCEAFRLAERLGLDAQRFFDIASTASGQCWSMTSYCPMPGPVPSSPANRDYAAGFTAAMMLKDLRLADKAAGDADARIALAAQALQIYEAFCAGEGAELDFSAIIKSL